MRVRVKPGSSCSDRNEDRVGRGTDVRLVSFCRELYRLTALAPVFRFDVLPRLSVLLVPRRSTCILLPEEY